MRTDKKLRRNRKAKKELAYFANLRAKPSIKHAKKSACMMARIKGPHSWVQARGCVQ